MTRQRQIAMAGLLLATLGCSSSSPSQTSGPGGACTTRNGADASSGESMSWKDDGTPECAFTASVSRETTALVDTAEISGATAANRSVRIDLSSYAGPLGGTYAC